MLVSKVNPTKPELVAWAQSIPQGSVVGNAPFERDSFIRSVEQAKGTDLKAIKAEVKEKYENESRLERTMIWSAADMILGGPIAGAVIAGVSHGHPYALAAAAVVTFGSMVGGVMQALESGKHGDHARVAKLFSDQLDAYGKPIRKPLPPILMAFHAFGERAGIPPVEVPKAGGKARFAYLPI